MDIPVVDVMTTNIVYVKPTDSVLTAVKKMIKVGIGNVLVINEGRLEGLITEKDIITKVVALNVNPEKVKAGEIMTRKVITAKPSMNIQQAARKMIKEGIRRIPIKDKGKIIGVITNTDILRIEPALIDILIERIKYNNPRFSESVSGGVCEVCNSYNARLIRVNGSMVCSKCKKEI